jgi:hypothetical protein
MTTLGGVLDFTNTNPDHARQSFEARTGPSPGQ